MNITAIDPGTRRSAFVTLDGAGVPTKAGTLDNAELLEVLAELGRDAAPDIYRRAAVVLVIEQVESFGMSVGAEVFETVHWAGRFYQAAQPIRVERLPRRVVKLHLCGTPRAKDPNIRQALIDRFGGSEAIGRKASPGPLYGIRGDEWAALAVAVTWHDIGADTWTEHD